MANLGHYGPHKVQIEARPMTDAEFDHIKSTYKELGLWCVECKGGMYPQVRVYYDGRRKLFAHMPGTLATCPARRDETPTHHDLKHLVAAIAEERLGLRALIDEKKFAGLKPDVMLFDREKPESAGPRAVYEIQQSPLDLATFDSRDKRLNNALQRLDSGTYERRVAPWLFTHEPTYETTRALIEVASKLDGQWQAYGGVWQSPDRDGGFVDAPLADVMADMHAGKIVRLEESERGARVSYWTRFGNQKAQRAPAKLSTQEWESKPCDRPPPVRSTRYTAGSPICTVCGNPIMWTNTRTTHVVCEATQ